jgi:hypothetical protein
LLSAIFFESCHQSKLTSGLVQGHNTLIFPSYRSVPYQERSAK